MRLLLWRLLLWARAGSLLWFKIQGWAVLEVPSAGAAHVCARQRLTVMAYSRTIVLTKLCCYTNLHLDNPAFKQISHSCSLPACQMLISIYNCYHLLGIASYSKSTSCWATAKTNCLGQNLFRYTQYLITRWVHYGLTDLSDYDVYEHCPPSQSYRIL